MSAIGKIRYRLAAARTGLLELRPQFRRTKDRVALAYIVRGIEGLMDYADQHFYNPLAKAAATTWREDEPPAGQDFEAEADVAAVVAAAVSEEREACALVCEHYAQAIDHGGNPYLRSDCMRAAAAIRARAQQTGITP